MNSLWDLYKKTVFLVEQNISTTLDFAIITACNPKGELQSHCRNRLLDQSLQSDIRKLGVIYRSLYGCSPQFDHQEKSWLVVADKARVTELANKYQQNAIYWVEQGELYLTPCCMTEYQEEYIAPFQERVVCRML